MRPTFFSRRTALIGTFAVFTLGLQRVRAQTPVKQQAELTVLTVAGVIEAVNRTPFNADADRFLQQRNISFTKAKTFTPAELSWLPQQSVQAKETFGEVTFVGPYLSDVLRDAKVAVAAKTVRIVSLDGYAIELALADLPAQNWVLAHSMGDKPLGIGDLGPLYLVRAIPGLERTPDENNNWVHSVFYIEVMV